jgi:hypothetical protein
MSFANAVLQLLLRSPRFWNLFKELGDLKGQRGARGPDTGGATPLVDATTRLFEEFMFKEESPSPQQAAGAKTREDEEVNRMLNAVDVFKPIYMYDAMREKRQLNNLLVRFRAIQHPDVADLLILFCSNMVLLVLSEAKNLPWLCRSRNHGTNLREIRGASALQAVWGALPPRRDFRKRTLYGRCASIIQRRKW